MGTPMSKVRTTLSVTSPLQAIERGTSGFEDSGRRWAPRSALLFGGAISLLVWGAMAFAVAAMR